MKITRKQLRELIVREISNLTEAPRPAPQTDVDWNQSKLSASEAAESLAAAIQAAKDVAKSQLNRPDMDDIQAVVGLGEAAQRALAALQNKLASLTDDGDPMMPSITYATTP